MSRVLLPALFRQCTECDGVIQFCRYQTVDQYGMKANGYHPAQGLRLWSMHCLHELEGLQYMWQASLEHTDGV